MDLFSRIKKSVASVAFVAMAFTILAPVASAMLPFTDAAEIPSWAEEAIEELMDQGVLGGNDDGSFAPNRQLNRAEVSKVIVLASGVDFDTTGGPHFPDVSADAWYYDYVETMYNYGWINGYPDGLFRPGVGINRVEVAKMVVNAFEIDQDLSGAPHFDDVTGSDWFYGYVETAYNNGLMRGYGDGTFGPSNAVTRAETAHITYNSQLVVAPIMGPAEGTLEVTLSDMTPRGTNVPYNATSVPYLTVEVTASDDSDVEISSMTYTRLGLGDNDDFDNVWLEIDGFKVGNDKSVNNDDIVELRFNPPVVVPAGQTLIADVVASAKYLSTDKNVGHHSRFALVSADDVASTAVNVVGDFPIEGEEMEVADYEVSQLTFSSLGSATTVDVGDNFIEIGKFRLLNASNTNKDVELRAVTFKNDGTAELEDDLENVALYVSGEQVSAESIIDGDYLTFRLDNGVTGGFVLEDGDSKIFSLRADIVSAESQDSIIFKIDNYEDVVGVEIGTSFGVKAISGNSSTVITDTAYGCTNTSSAEDKCATLSTYTIDSGDLNVSRDPSSLGNQEYSPGSNDVVALTARLVVDQPLLVDGIYIDVASTSTVADKTDTGSGANQLADFNYAFDNFRLFLNDQLVDTENDFTMKTGTAAALEVAGTPANFTLNFNTTFEIAGTSILKIVMNVADGAVTDDSLKLEIAASDFQSPEYISTGDQVATAGLLGSASGSFVNIQKSTYTVVETSGLSDGDKLVAGVDDVTFMEVTIDNNDSGDINITSLTVAARTIANDAGTGTISTNVSGSARTYSNFTLAVFVDGTQQGSAKNLSSVTATAGQATFNDLSVVIPSAMQKEFVIVVDTIESSATAIATTTGAVTTSTTLTVVDSTDMEAGDIVSFAKTGVTTELEAIASVTDATTVVLEAAPTGEFYNATILAGEHTGTMTTITVATSTVFQIGDVLTIAGAVTNIPLVVTAIPGGGATLTVASTAFTTDPTDTAVITGSNAGTVTVKHQIGLDLTVVEADNVENGQSVYETSSGTSSTLNTAVVGKAFELVSSGTLTASVNSAIASDLLIAGQSNVEILKLRLNAADDEVQVKDLYFENDNYNVAVPPHAGDRMDFKLYNESGTLIQEKTMSGGTLHFELANADRIRVPKDDSTFVTVKADIRDITKANQTGAKLLLALNADTGTNAFYGIQAVTAATGDDIATPTAGWGDAVGQAFVAYNSALTIEAAASQPTMALPSVGSTEIYRFTVTADAADNASIGRVTMDVDLNGLKTSATLPVAFTTQKVVDGSPDVGQTFATTIIGGFLFNSAVGGRVAVEINESLAGNSSETYAVFMSNTAEDGTVVDSDGVTVSLVRDASYVAPAIKATQDAVGTAAVAQTATVTLAETATGDGVLTVTLAGALTTTQAITNGDTAPEVVVAFLLAHTTAYAGVGITIEEGATTSTILFTATTAGTPFVTPAEDITAASMTAEAAAGTANVRPVYNKLVVWSDESDPSHSATTVDWLNGYLLDVDTAGLKLQR